VIQSVFCLYLALSSTREQHCGGRFLKKVLLVEDEAITRLHLAQFLTDEGYLVIPVAAGEEAVKIMHTESFDVVITGYKLGGVLTGVQVLTYFERLSPTKGKMLITADPSQRIAASSIGALYVSKPIQLDDLVLKLKSLLP
jgi:DNA-binding response OmpR family regulator